jgi:hypothetical protein
MERRCKRCGGLQEKINDWSKYFYCRPCHNSRRKKVNREPNLNDRECLDCKVFKKYDEFYYKTSKPNICKACLKRKQKEYHLKKAQIDPGYFKKKLTIQNENRWRSLLKKGNKIHMKCLTCKCTVKILRKKILKEEANDKAIQSPHSS